MNVDDAAQGWMGQPGTKRIIAVAAALFLALPAVFIWAWQIDRWRSGSAASSAYDKGEKALSEGDAVKALIAFSHARELRPSDPTFQRGVWRARARLIAESSDRLTADNVEDIRFEVEQLVSDDKANASTYLTAW